MKFQTHHHVDVVKRDELRSEYRENAFVHLENVRAALEKIPAEYRADAVFEIRTWEDRDGLDAHAMTISYERPPTDAEAEQQIADERRRVANDIAWLQRRALDISKEAADCGYVLLDDQWPFKPDMPVPAVDDES